ncbi:MAG: phage tail protein [Sphingobacteriales bacterium]|nr:MAG: phage tail protein [Sphingobacteriales bacterium]
MEGYLGEVRNFAGNFAPQGWRFCQGEALAISDYDALFALIGATYGGDGINTFNLPDLRGRVAVGTGQGPGLANVNLGGMAGSEQVTLTANNLPIHNHTVTNSPINPSITASVNSAQATAHAATTGLSIASAGSNASGQFIQNLGFNNTTPTVALNPGTVDLSAVTINSEPSGGSQPHSNMQPYLSVNFIICVQGIFPSRN